MLRKWNAIVRNHNARKGQISPVIEAGPELRSLEHPAAGRLGHSRNHDRAHRAGGRGEAIDARVYANRKAERVEQKDEACVALVVEAEGRQEARADEVAAARSGLR